MLACRHSRIKAVAAVGLALIFAGAARSGSQAPPLRLLSSPQAAATSLTETNSQGRAPPGVWPCDWHAAHKEDPEAVGPGMADEGIEPRDVIPACEAAVRQDGNTPRLRFQLARGYLAAGRIDDAARQLLTAAQAGHGGALAYLADLYVEGVPGIAADPALAKTLYEKALAAGFKPARTVLAAFVDRTAEFEAAEKDNSRAQDSLSALGPGKGFMNPDIIANILAGQFNDVPRDELWAKRYLIVVGEEIAALCKAHLSTNDIEDLNTHVAARNTLFPVEEAISRIFLVLNIRSQRADPFTAVFSVFSQLEANGTSETAFDEGLEDAQALLQRFPCQSPQLALFTKHLKSFVKDEGAPWIPPMQMFKQCTQWEKRGINRTEMFCGCLTGSLSFIPVTRQDRVGLSAKESFHDTMNQLFRRSMNGLSHCVM